MTSRAVYRLRGAVSDGYAALADARWQVRAQRLATGKIGRWVVGPLALASMKLVQRPEVREALCRGWDRMANMPAQWLGNEPSQQEVRRRLVRIVEQDPTLALHIVGFRPKSPLDIQDAIVVGPGREITYADGLWNAFQACGRGHSRAYALMRAIHAICESPYMRLLELLWRLDAAERGSRKEPPAFLGRLIDDLQGAFPELVDPEAKFFRNAAAHHGYRYVPDRDALVFVKVPRKGEPDREVSVAELEAWADGLRQRAGTVFPLHQIVVAEILRRGEFLGLLLEGLAELAGSCDPHPRVQQFERAAEILGFDLGATAHTS